MLKKLFLIYVFFSNIFIIYITSAATRTVWDSYVKDALLWITKNDVIATKGSGLSMLDSILKWVKDSLTWLLAMIAIWAFLFIWVRLALARWNADAFKKAINQLVYAIVWIFLVAIAWAAVKLVAWLNF